MVVENGQPKGRIAINGKMMTESIAGKCHKK
jgi:hypothetical protein